jgi:hypothetical protein
MKDKTPKKKQSKAKKSEKFDPSVASNDIKEITQKALASFLKEQLTNKTNSKKNIDALTSVIEEFLSSYILLGYSFDGKPLNIIFAHNQQEADSLTTLINKFINSCGNGSNEGCEE